MNTIKKSSAVTWFIGALLLLPLSAEAETSVFSYLGGYGSMGLLEYTDTHYSYFTVTATGNVIRRKSDKTINSPGVSVYGSYWEYDSDSNLIACWSGDGSYSDDIQIQFNKTPKPQIIASGSILIDWYNYCGWDYFQEHISFKMDLGAVTDQLTSTLGTTITKAAYDNLTITTHNDNKSAPAIPNVSSFISSPSFGTLSAGNNTNSLIGISNGNSVTIIRK